MPARNVTGPRKLTLRAYNVGFGDCLLLSFEYARGPTRHVLVDCGTVGLPHGAEKGHMKAVVGDILEVTGRSLDGLIITHRHRDHTSALDTKVDSVTLRGVARRVVVPWTEATPSKDGDPGEASSPRRKGATWRALRSAIGPVVARARRLSAKVTTGSDAHSFAARLGNGARPLRALRALVRINQAAAGPLDGAKSQPTEYVKAGDPTGLEALLPGVTLRVIGPPPPEERDEIDSYAKRSDEYWLRSRAAQGFWAAQAEAAAHEGVEPFPDAERLSPSEVPAHMRWFLRQLDEAAAEESLAVMRALDDALNNTSVMLLIEMGEATLLLPGDAQLEAWRCARALEGVEETLGRVTVYKVSHHGSRNATPRSALRAMTHDRKRRGKNKLLAILSSRTGVHGGHGTEVPRETLLQSLSDGAELVYTQDLDSLCAEVEITPNGRARVKATASPR